MLTKHPHAFAASAAIDAEVRRLRSPSRPFSFFALNSPVRPYSAEPPQEDAELSRLRSACCECNPAVVS